MARQRRETCYMLQQSCKKWLLEDTEDLLYPGKGQDRHGAAQWNPTCVVCRSADRMASSSRPFSLVGKQSSRLQRSSMGHVTDDDDDDDDDSRKTRVTYDSNGRIQYKPGHCLIRIIGTLELRFHRWFFFRLTAFWTDIFQLTIGSD